MWECNYYCIFISWKTMEQKTISASSELLKLLLLLLLLLDCRYERQMKTQKEAWSKQQLLKFPMRTGPFSCASNLSLSLSPACLHIQWGRNGLEFIRHTWRRRRRETKPDPKCERRRRRGRDTAAATCNRQACIADGFSHLKKTPTPAENHALGANG